MIHEVRERETRLAENKVSKTISHAAALTRAKFCNIHFTGQRVEHVMKMQAHKGNEIEICKNRVNSSSEHLLLAQTNPPSQKSKLQKSLPHVKSAKIHILYFLQCKFLKDFQISKRKFLLTT